MPAGDPAVLRMGDEQHGPLGLDEIRGNSTEVIEDHNLFREVQAARARAVKPRSFEDVLAAEWELSSTPLPESEVAAATAAAAEALWQEQDRAGAIVAPEARIQGGEPEGAHLDPPAAHLVDFRELAQHLEGRVGELQGALTGLAIRVEELARSGAPPRKPDQSSARGQEGAPPARARGPVRAPSLQERRVQRQNGGEQAQEGQEHAEERAAGPEAWPGPLEALPGPGGRLGHFSLDPRIVGFVVGGVGVAAVVILFWGWRAGDGGEEAIVERQVQGLGAYVRAEQQELGARVRRVPRLMDEAERLRGDLARARTDDEGRRVRSRLDEVQRDLARAQMAQIGVRALEEVSGVPPQGKPD